MPLAAQRGCFGGMSAWRHSVAAWRQSLAASPNGVKAWRYGGTAGDKDATGGMPDPKLSLAMFSSCSVSVKLLPPGPIQWNLFSSVHGARRSVQPVNQPLPLATRLAAQVAAKLPPGDTGGGTLGGNNAT